jgi:hypothetical protein
VTPEIVEDIAVDLRLNVKATLPSLEEDLRELDEIDVRRGR